MFRITLCVTAIAAYYALCRFLIYAVSPDFGMGVGTGFTLAVLLYFLAEKSGLRETRY